MKKNLLLSMCMLVIMSACTSQASKEVAQANTALDAWKDYFVGNILFEDKAPESEGSRIYHSIIADPKAYIT